MGEWSTITISHPISPFLRGGLPNPTNRTSGIGRQRAGKYLVRLLFGWYGDDPCTMLLMASCRLVLLLNAGRWKRHPNKEFPSWGSSATFGHEDWDIVSSLNQLADFVCFNIEKILTWLWSSWWSNVLVCSFTTSRCWKKTHQIPSW